MTLEEEGRKKKKMVHDIVIYNKRKFASETVDILSQKNYSRKKNGEGDPGLIYWSS